MPFTTYANQKSVCIHKPAVRSNFLQIANSDWMEANKTLTPYGLQLYLYLASNADGFNLELSPQHAENAAGIRRTTFYEYLRKLEISGYLVWRRSNHYDFYTTPRPVEERTHPDHHKDYITFESNPSCESTDSCEFAAETVSPQDDKACPPSNHPCSTGDIVIDNRYIPENKTYNNIEKPDAQAHPVPIVERVITIPVPQSRPRPHRRY